MPSRLAVDDGDGRAPVALPAEQPVAQPIGDLGLGAAGLGQLGHDRLAALVGRAGRRTAPLLTRCSSAAWAMNAVVHGIVGGDAGGRDDPADRQPELLGEREVALVVRGHGHDRAGAVAGQHVVGDEDRDPLAVDRVDGIGAQRHPGLLAVGRQAVDLGPAPRLLDVGRDLLAPIRVREAVDQRVLRGEDHERRPEQRVGSGREDAQGVAARLKSKQQSVADRIYFSVVSSGTRPACFRRLRAFWNGFRFRFMTAPLRCGCMRWNWWNPR